VTEQAAAPVAVIRDALLDAVKPHSPVLADDVTIMVLRYVGQKGTS
jgi:hypothetical protein